MALIVVLLRYHIDFITKTMVDAVSQPKNCETQIFLTKNASRGGSTTVVLLYYCRVSTRNLKSGKSGKSGKSQGNHGKKLGVREVREKEKKVREKSGKPGNFFSPKVREILGNFKK